MKQFIGICVIAMNNIYNFNYDVNEILYTNTMKFFQSSVITNPTFYNKNIKYDKSNSNTLEFECSEFSLDCISWKNLMIKDVINCLVHFVNSQNSILFLPIITIFDESLFSMKAGHYCMGLQNESLIRYLDLNLQYAYLINYTSKLQFTISLFLDVKKVISLYNEIGFIHGVLQIGQLINCLKSNLDNYNILEMIGIPQQVLTYQLGINNTEMLLIANLSIEKNMY